MKVALWAFLASICLPFLDQPAAGSVDSVEYCFELGWASVLIYEDDCRVGQDLN